MYDRPNITKRRGHGLARNAGMVVAGFVSMVCGLCLGSYIADARADRAIVQGTRLATVLHLARSGPLPLRRAAMAAIADGVLTAREERHLYMVADMIRREQARARRAMEGGDDAGMRHRPDQMI